VESYSRFIELFESFNISWLVEKINIIMNEIKSIIEKKFKIIIIQIRQNISEKNIYKLFTSWFDILSKIL
jgi:hypothetical protein